MTDVRMDTIDVITMSAVIHLLWVSTATRQAKKSWQHVPIIAYGMCQEKWEWTQVNYDAPPLQDLPSHPCWVNSGVRTNSMTHVPVCSSINIREHQTSKFKGKVRTPVCNRDCVNIAFSTEAVRKDKKQQGQATYRSAEWYRRKSIWYRRYSSEGPRRVKRGPSRSREISTSRQRHGALLT